MTPELELRFALLDRMAQYAELTLTSMSLFISAVTAFLVVAWVVGARLRRLQAAVVVAIYLAFSAFVIWGAFFDLTVIAALDPRNFGLDLLNKSRAVDIARTMFRPQYVLLVIQLTIVAASLWFFFDIRRNGRESRP